MEDTSGLFVEVIRGPFIEVKRGPCVEDMRAPFVENMKTVCERHEKTVCRGHERDNEYIIGSYLCRSCATRQQRNIRGQYLRRLFVEVKPKGRNLLRIYGFKTSEESL